MVNELIVSCIGLVDNAVVRYFDDVVGNRLDELMIMGSEDNRSGEANQSFVQSRDRFQI